MIAATVLAASFMVIGCVPTGPVEKPVGVEVRYFVTGETDSADVWFVMNGSGKEGMAPLPFEYWFAYDGSPLLEVIAFEPGAMLRAGIVFDGDTLSNEAIGLVGVVLYTEELGQ